LRWFVVADCPSRLEKRAVCDTRAIRRSRAIANGRTGWKADIAAGRHAQSESILQRMMLLPVNTVITSELSWALVLRDVARAPLTERCGCMHSSLKTNP
jgi:hypothetical protein